MDYRICRNISFPSFAAVPFALISSECNSVAAITLQGIKVFVSILLNTSFNVISQQQVLILCKSLIFSWYFQV